MSTRNDPRFEHTHQKILTALQQLMCQKDYLSLTVTELCRTCGIDRKTFYRHFHSLEDVLQEIQRQVEDEYLERTRNLKRPDDIDEITRIFISMREEMGVFGEKLTCSPNNLYISSQIDRSTMAKTWRSSQDPEQQCQQNILKAFISGATLAMYRQWIKDGRQIPLEDFIDQAIVLLTRGNFYSPGTG